MSGMAGLLKSIGVDTDQFQAHFETFTAGMRAQAETINANQLRIEAQGARIEAKLDALADRLDSIAPAPSTVEVLEDDKPTGVLITSEKFPQAMLDDVAATKHEQREPPAEVQRAAAEIAAQLIRDHNDGGASDARRREPDSTH
jgi:hypothetical protein